MESRQRRVWHQAAGALFYTRFAQCHARLRHNSIQRAGASIPYQACGLDNKNRTFVGRQKCVFCWHGVRDSEPTTRSPRGSARVGQTALRSRWSLPIRRFLLNGQFERRFSTQTPYQQKNRGIKSRFFCWHGVRDSEPRRASSATNRPPLPLVATDPHFYVILRFERRSHPKHHTNRKAYGRAVGFSVGTV